MIEFECLYCGEKWYQQFEPDFIGCSICKEVKMIKKVAIDCLDAYGYRYSQPFPKPNKYEDIVNTYGDDYFASNNYTD